jgi:hypothetical protein
MTIYTSVSDYSLPFGGVTIDKTQPITFAGHVAYLDFCETGKQNTNTISFVNLSSSNTDPASFMPTKNVPASNIKIAMNYWGTPDSPTVTKPLSYILADSNYIDAKLLLESMSY